MLEEIIEQFIQRLKRIAITDERMTSVPLAYILTLDLPESIKHFLDQEVELWIREEEEKFTSNERFNYDRPEVRMLIDQIFDILKQDANFHVNKFNQLLERAVKLEMSYLIEPQRTLTQFLFKDSQKLSTIEVHDTLKYFFRYEYYKTAISEYFNMKYLREITQDQFRDLLVQIDEKAFAEKREETILKVIKTIMSFLSDVHQKEVNSLNTEVLLAAFRDRKLDDYSLLVKKVQDRDGLSELTFDEIESMIREGRLPGDQAPAQKRDETEIIGFEETEDIETSKPEVTVDDIEMTEAGVVTEEEPEEDEYEEDVEEEEVEEPVPPAVNVASDLADHVARQISSDNPLENLHDMFKGRIRRRIIKKLFAKNESDFTGFLNQLNGLPTWKEASHLIDDEFYERGVNPYSKDAITFSDVVYVRFFPKDKYVGGEDEYDKF